MIVKICKIHGELTQDEIRVNNNKSRKNPQVNCHLCRLEWEKKYREKNKEKLNAYQREWGAKNPEKRIKSHKKYRDNNPEKRREAARKSNKSEKMRAYKKEYTKLARKVLKTEYIKKLIVGDSGLSHKDIPIQMVETKRALLELKRTLKEKLKNE